MIILTKKHVYLSKIWFRCVRSSTRTPRHIKLKQKQITLSSPDHLSNFLTLFSSISHLTSAKNLVWPFHSSMHTSKHRSNQTHLSVSITCYFLQSSTNKYKENYIHIHTEHKETSPNDDTCCETQHKLSINIIKFVYSHRSNERENRKQIHKLYTSLLSCHLPFSSLRTIDTEEYTFHYFESINARFHRYSNALLSR